MHLQTPPNVSVGYICPLCRERVVVISSQHPPKTGAYEFESRCSCGYGMVFGIDELTSLEVWRDRRKTRAA